MAPERSWIDGITPNLHGLATHIDRRLATVVDFYAPVAEAEMRSNAPWTDRTTNARNGLFAKPVHQEGEHALVMGHTVDYGIWLETRWSGRYAIVLPTMHSIAEQMMVTIQGVLGEVNPS